MPVTSSAGEAWPPLPLEPWKDTLATLHMWTQVVGKVCLALTPLVNHYWNIALSEFILPYEAVRTAASPEAELSAFLTSTYDAAANLARWPRADLERGRETARQ